jgi:cell division protein ZapA (FtsZ GTPase activity inhibitor)
MGQVSVTLNGRTYRLSCEDGEEPHLLDVVGHVRGHVDQLISEHGQIGDERLLLMASILVTDELYELRKAVEHDALALEGAPRETSAKAAEVLAPRIIPVVAAAPRPPLPTPVSPQPVIVPRLQPAEGGPVLSPSPAPRATTVKIAATPANKAAAPPASAPPARPADLLDATALMKGLENKVARP